MDSEQIKKVVVKAVLKNQILVKGGAEIHKDLLKIVPFFKKKKKKAIRFPNWENWP